MHGRVREARVGGVRYGETTKDPRKGTGRSVRVARGVGLAVVAVGRVGVRGRGRARAEAASCGLDPRPEVVVRHVVGARRR